MALSALAATLEFCWGVGGLIQGELLHVSRAGDNKRVPLKLTTAGMHHADFTIEDASGHTFFIHPFAARNVYSAAISFLGMAWVAQLVSCYHPDNGLTTAIAFGSHAHAALQWFCLAWWLLSFSGSSFQFCGAAAVTCALASAVLSLVVLVRSVLFFRKGYRATLAVRFGSSLLLLATAGNIALIVAASMEPPDLETEVRGSPVHWGPQGGLRESPLDALRDLGQRIGGSKRMNTLVPHTEMAFVGAALLVVAALAYVPVDCLCGKCGRWPAMQAGVMSVIACAVNFWQVFQSLAALPSSLLGFDWAWSLVLVLGNGLLCLTASVMFFIGSKKPAFYFKESELFDAIDGGEGTYAGFSP